MRCGASSRQPVRTAVCADACARSRELIEHFLRVIALLEHRPGSGMLVGCSVGFRPDHLWAFLSDLLYVQAHTCFALPLTLLGMRSLALLGMRRLVGVVAGPKFGPWWAAVGAGIWMLFRARSRDMQASHRPGSDAARRERRHRRDSSAASRHPLRRALLGSRRHACTVEGMAGAQRTTPASWASRTWRLHWRRTCAAQRPGSLRALRWLVRCRERVIAPK